MAVEVVKRDADENSQEGENSQKGDASQRTDAGRADGGVASDRTISGLDALELAGMGGRTSRGRLWAATWPKLLAVAIFVAVWQVVALSGWRPAYVLAPPADVASELGTLLTSSEFWHGLVVTLRRAIVGFTLATVIGLALGVAVARVKVLRAAFGSMITALQTMPSIAWFPLAILLLQLSGQY